MTNRGLIKIITEINKIYNIMNNNIINMIK